jgi:hypothetical protein
VISSRLLFCADSYLHFYQPFDIQTKRENTSKNMDKTIIIAELEAEGDRLSSAIAALQGGRSTPRTLLGRSDGRSRRRHLSAAARRKIGKAMKKR